MSFDPAQVDVFGHVHMPVVSSHVVVVKHEEISDV
jgi:hypothetical protein